MKIISFICALFFITSIAFPQSSLQDAARLLEKKEFDQARTIFESILKNNDNDAEAHGRLGRLLMGHYRLYDEAEDHLEKAVELAGGKAEYHWYLGLVYGAQAMRVNVFSKISYAGKTKAEFLKAVELNPDDIRFRESLMAYYLMAPGILGGSVDKAKEQAKEMIRLNACSGHIACAQIALYEKNSTLAEQELKQAIQTEPKNWRPYHRLGYLYVEQQRYGDAISQFEQYVNLAPADPNSYDSLGEGYYLKGETDTAIVQFRKALSLDPNFSPSIYNLGRSYEKKAMKSDALTNYRRYLDTDPEGQFAGEAGKRIKELSQ